MQKGDQASADRQNRATATLPARIAFNCIAKRAGKCNTIDHMSMHRKGLWIAALLAATSFGATNGDTRLADAAMNQDTQTVRSF